VAGRRGAAVEDDFYNIGKLEKLKTQCISREKGQNSVGACATHMRSA